MARIGIDARMITHSGIGTYLKNILSNLQQTHGHEYILFGDAVKLKEYGLQVIPAPFPIYSLAEQVLYPSILKGAALDLFHATHYNVPLRYTQSLVTTIHDLIHILYPHYLSSRFAYYYARYMIRSACKKSERIMVISENTKNDLIQHFQVNASRIDIVYPDIKPQFIPSRQKAGVFLKKYGRYILYVGALRPHKNILVLLEAFAACKKKSMSDHRLILIGSGKRDYMKKINYFLSGTPLTRDVIHLQDIAQDELIDFYSNADVFVFPSLYEGFGLPPLEAMACGCPVITSNTSSLLEVVGDAALTVNPHNIEKLADAILSVVSNKALSHDLASKGMLRAQMFPFGKTARETISVYNKIIQN